MLTLCSLLQMYESYFGMFNAIKRYLYFYQNMLIAFNGFWSLKYFYIQWYIGKFFFSIGFVFDLHQNLKPNGNSQSWKVKTFRVVITPLIQLRE